MPGTRKVLNCIFFINGNIINMRFYALIISVLFITGSLDAQKASYPSTPEISGTVFISFRTSYNHFDNEPDEDLAGFHIRRGYLTLKGDLTERASYRFTIDAFDDEEGAEYRLKYCYLDYRLNDAGKVFTDNKMKFGLTKTSLIDMQSKVNRFRMNEKMFGDRMDILTSSDLGFAMAGNIGGKLEKSTIEKTASKDCGYFGGWHIGVYNGGSYSYLDLEYNMNYQGRISIRPLPELLPGLRLNAFGLISKMNLDTDSPNDNKPWHVENYFATYNNRKVNLMAEYMTGYGSRFGEMIDSEGKEIHYEGYSAFGEFRFTPKISAIARYDYMSNYYKSPDSDFSSFSAGIGYDFGASNILMISYDLQEYDKTQKSILMVTTQLKY